MGKSDKDIIKISKNDLKKIMVLTTTLVTVSTAGITSIIVNSARTAHQRNIGAEYIAEKVDESGIVFDLEKYDVYTGSDGTLEFYEGKTVYDDSVVGEPDAYSFMEKINNQALVRGILSNCEGYELTEAEIEIYFEVEGYNDLCKFIDVSREEKNKLKEEAYHLHMLEEMRKGSRNGK